MMINPREEYFMNKGKKEGMKEGKKEGIETVAKNLIKDGIPIPKISQLTGLTKKEIEKMN